MAPEEMRSDETADGATAPAIDYTQVSKGDVFKGGRLAALAYVTGNGDAHAKNFSIVQDVHGRWGPSPAYDVPTSQPYGDNSLALSIGGKRDGNIPGRSFVELGVALGLNQTAARRSVERIADSVDLWLPGLEALPFDSGRLNMLRRVISRRRDLLRV